MLLRPLAYQLVRRHFRFLRRPATAQVGATPEAAANSVPKEATAETSESASQGIKAEEPTAQSMTGSIEDALDQLDEPVAAGSTSAEGASDVEQSGKGEAVSEHNNP
jgi:hypothetical protein